MSRRTEIADAAIATLAAEGMRGLTHRAVDRVAGLPEGSTSYYFRTRQALLQAVVERLVERDRSEVPTMRGASLDGFVDLGAQIVHALLTVERVRLLARYELHLESTRRPELRELLGTAGGEVRAMMGEALESIGVPDAQRRAWNFAAFLDGYMFDRVAGVSTGAVGVDPPDIEEVRDVLRALVRATTAPGAPTGT
jgi:AcrR family transcriptional regulator